MLEDDQIANRLDDVSNVEPSAIAEEDLLEEFVPEVDDSQVVEVVREHSANPRDIMAVDAEMVLETIAEVSEAPAPKEPVSQPVNQKDQELVALRKTFARITT